MVTEFLLMQSRNHKACFSDYNNSLYKGTEYIIYWISAHIIS
ncbi:hypothetical protein HanXRQr2_Chr14g0662571 [Helianthus annuus]|uniref:Uncharacterized protein n=1 Tax=Helianthus annuus TaxID=4232 RepID=A0A9K3EBA3_HELAN|nr:hypothetical protein HanXRQr2_Chr14g0662571 [Helianthus annuus]